jgi:N-hydroxyarylamine O-acetyltransferase
MSASFSTAEDDFDLRAYLLRIGVPPVAATREGLATLHEAHLAAIPFENLDILLGKPILLASRPSSRSS